MPPTPPPLAPQLTPSDVYGSNDDDADESVFRAASAEALPLPASQHTPKSLPITSPSTPTALANVNHQDNHAFKAEVPIAAAEGASSSHLTSLVAPTTPLTQAAERDLSAAHEYRFVGPNWNGKDLVESTLEQNWRWLRKQQLPSFGSFNWYSINQLPLWLRDARLNLRARVVDYLNGGSGEAHMVVAYLKQLGFEVELDSSMSQRGASCGIVAAVVALLLHRAGVNWQQTNVHSAADHDHIRLANMCQDEWASYPGNDDNVDDNHRPIDARFGPTALNRNPTATRFLSTTEIVRLVRSLVGTNLISEWFTVSALDSVILQITRDLYRVATDATGCTEVPLTICIPNTQFSTMKGCHWFTVAYSISANPQRVVNHRYEDVLDIDDEMIEAAVAAAEDTSSSSVPRLAEPTGHQSQPHPFTSKQRAQMEKMEAVSHKKNARADSISPLRSSPPAMPSSAASPEPIGHQPQPLPLTAKQQVALTTEQQVRLVQRYAMALEKKNVKIVQSYAMALENRNAQADITSPLMPSTSMSLSAPTGHQPQPLPLTAEQQVRLMQNYTMALEKKNVGMVQSYAMALKNRNAQADITSPLMSSTTIQSASSSQPTDHQSQSLPLIAEQHGETKCNP